MLRTLSILQRCHAFSLICALCRACQTVLAALLDGLVGALAPIASHLAEDAWPHLPHTAFSFHAVTQVSLICASAGRARQCWQRCLMAWSEHWPPSLPI